MGEEQDARYAARQAEIERAYASLPAPGTPAYQQALEGAQGEVLPLEVLVRCYRERQAARDDAQANRIYELVLGCVQTPTQYWARAVARRVPPHARNDLEERLEYDCYAELWKVMKDPEQAFILVNFHHMLQQIQKHIMHAVMQQEGYWTRPGVETPKRVPRNMTDSFDRPARDANDPDAPAIQVEDRRAEQAFGRAEMAADMETLLQELSPGDRALLHDYFWRGLSQDEIADALGITDRTVRNRLKRILTYLRRLLQGEEEDPDGD